MIDGDHLARQTAGDTDLQRELLTLFRTQLDDLRSALDTALAAGGRPGMAIETMLHRVRGAAAAVGATGLAGQLHEAETALTQAHDVEPVLRPLRDALADACAALPGLIAARGRGGLAKAEESR